MSTNVHPLHRVVSLEIVGPCVLSLTFEDGLVRTIDFRPVLRGEMFGPLRDATVFNQVSIDPQAHTLVWPNGADFDPAMLHDWPEVEAALIERAAQWADNSR